MTKTEKNILDAAVRLFSRYGVKRTSMGDLAQEAGVSRQTLYNAFKNKDDVLRALIRLYTEEALAEIEAALDLVQALGDQLDIVFDKMVVAGFDLVATMPNAQDLIDGFNSAGKEEMGASAEKFRVVIERILSPHHAALAKAGLTPSNLSDFVQRSAKAAGGTARDKDQLVSHLRTLKHLCLAAAGQ
ncbi:MAG: TetR family transcriptional regulator [Bauldia litoralis]